MFSLRSLITFFDIVFRPEGKKPPKINQCAHLPRPERAGVERMLNEAREKGLLLTELPDVPSVPENPAILVEIDSVMDDSPTRQPDKGNRYGYRRRKKRKKR